MVGRAGGSCCPFWGCASELVRQTKLEVAFSGYERLIWGMCNPPRPRCSRRSRGSFGARLAVAFVGPRARAAPRCKARRGYRSYRPAPPVGAARSAADRRRNAPHRIASRQHGWAGPGRAGPGQANRGAACTDTKRRRRQWFGSAPPH